ncbi:hypothetical protein FVE85_1328 [Porphyridium purpureum]|uniref:Plastid lipid-associated protein/fibrillin conserved domain-containing protein n=1 Tax=Porphyridium purpureum TaxID=35688 RepID=A0A5J4YHG5_PORPP|nr:hypothetical protein FVE85_1328 [Porphyridium purpureum]|eukprot:POR9166..scf251_18
MFVPPAACDAALCGLAKARARGPRLASVACPAPCARVTRKVDMRAIGLDELYAQASVEVQKGASGNRESLREYVAALRAAKKSLIALVDPQNEQRASSERHRDEDAIASVVDKLAAVSPTRLHHTAHPDLLDGRWRMFYPTVSEDRGSQSSLDIVSYLCTSASTSGGARSAEVGIEFQFDVESKALTMTLDAPVAAPVPKYRLRKQNRDYFRVHVEESSATCGSFVVVYLDQDLCVLRVCTTPQSDISAIVVLHKR